MKMLKVIIFMIIALQCAFGFAEFEWDKLSPKQKELANKIYKRGEEFNLGATLVSIAWQESRLGKYPVSFSDKSGACGVFHQVVKHYIKQHNLQDTELNRNIVCGNLIYDEDLAITQALEVLMFFKRYYISKKEPQHYPKMIKAYNAGFNTDSYAASVYYKQVYHNVKIIQSLKETILNYDKPASSENNIPLLYTKPSFNNAKLPLAKRREDEWVTMELIK